jgi:DNA-dependent RNA polymerase auxiliary subunit epsilon
MRDGETRFTFTAHRVTTTTVTGYVNATDSEDARRKLAENTGEIEIDQVGSVVDQSFANIRIGGPTSDDDD